MELECIFNLELNNLPTLLKKIIFNKDSKYNKELNCLPKFVEQIQLPIHYNKQIKKLTNFKTPRSNHESKVTNFKIP